MDEAITRRNFVDNVENLRLIQYLWQVLKYKNIPSGHGTFRMSTKGIGTGYQYELTSEELEVIISQILGGKATTSLSVFLVKPSDSKVFAKGNEVIPNELQLRWIRKTPFANFVVTKHLLHPLLKHDVRYAKQFIEKHRQEYEKCRQFLLSNKIELVEEVLTEIEEQPDNESVNTDKLISFLVNIFIQDTIAFLQTKGIEIDQTNRVDSPLMDYLEKLLNYRGEDAKAVKQLIELMSSYFVIHQNFFRKEQPVLHKMELKRFVPPRLQRVKIEEESPLYVAEHGFIPGPKKYSTKGGVVVPPLEHPIIENISSQPQCAVIIKDISPQPQHAAIIEDISPQPQYAVKIEEESPLYVAEHGFIPGPKKYSTKGGVVVPPLEHPIIENISSQPQCAVIIKDISPQPQHAAITEEDIVNPIQEKPAKKTGFPEHDDTVEIPNILRPEKDVVTKSFPEKSEKDPDIKKQIDNGVVDRNSAYSKLNKENGGMIILWGFPCMPFLLLLGIVITGFEFILIPITIFLVTLLVNKIFATEVKESSLKYTSLVGENGKELDGSSVDIPNAVRDRALCLNNSETLDEDQKANGYFANKERQRREIKDSIHSNTTPPAA